MEPPQRRVRLVWGNGSAPEGSGHGTACPGQWARPQAAGAQGAFGHRSQTLGLDIGWSCVWRRELGLMIRVGPSHLRMFHFSISTLTLSEDVIKGSGVT